MEEGVGTGGKTEMATGLEDNRTVNGVPISLEISVCPLYWCLVLIVTFCPKWSYSLPFFRFTETIHLFQRVLGQGFPSGDEGNGSHGTFSLGIYLKSLHKNWSFSEVFLFKSRHHVSSVVHLLTLSVLLCKQAFIWKLSHPWRTLYFEHWFCYD